jgi:DNA-binding Lrp family transcriptional regulator
MAKDQLDDIDKKIIRILQENGRITNLQLSQEVGLSPAPTLERVRKLENSKIIQSYHANIDPLKMGYGMKVLIQISLLRQKGNAMERFQSQILEIPEVIECEQVTGDFDYLLKVLVRDVSELDFIVNSKLSRIEEIGQMKSSVILSTVKDSKSIPV